MTSEEIQLRLGVDASALGKGIKSADRMVREWARGVKEAFKDLAMPLLGAFTAGGAISMFEKLTSKAEGISRIMESAGVSGKFVQDLQNVAMASGVASEKVEGMLSKFVKGLAPGTDPEKALLALADALKAQHDPATRAQMVVDAFGRSGAAMIPVLMRGADGLKQLAGSFAVLGNSELKWLHQSKAEIERWSDSVVVNFGRVLYSLRDMYNASGGNIWKFAFQNSGALGRAAALRDIAADKEDEQSRREAEAIAKSKADWNDFIALQKKLGELRYMQEQRSTAQQLKDSEGVFKWLQSQYSMAANDKDKLSIVDEMLRVEGLILDLKEKQGREDQKAKDAANQKLLLEQQIAYTQARAAMDRLSPYQPSIADLANGRGPFSRIAQEITMRTQLARQMFAGGNVAGANDQVNAIEGYDVAGRKLSPYEQRLESARQAWRKKTGFDIGGDDGKAHHMAGLKEQLEGAGVISPEKRLQAMEKHLADLNEKIARLTEPNGPALNVAPQNGN